MKFAAGKFQAEINDIDKFLRKIDFFEERNYYPNEDFDPSVYRGKSYIENWKMLISENIYNFILSDNSILHFKVKEAELKVSFTFYECPYICQTYKEFLEENGLSDDSDDKIFQEDYEEYLLQCALKENPTMIRYDLDYNSYYQGLHPVSHIHMGNKNQIRLGINKILMPKAFFNFVLRQHYPAQWKLVISEESDWKKSYLKEKWTLEEVNKKFWDLLDSTELHLF